MINANNPLKSNRIYFLDNLRSFMIFLVVMLHAGVVYESTGGAGFFWIVYDFSTNPVVDELNMIFDIFIMSIIFLISGYLTPVSLKSKNGREFIKTKIRRLMLPWALGVLILMPLYKMIFLYSRHMPQENWISYFHFNNGILSQSWLWYLPVLFMFDVIYLGLSHLKLKLPRLSVKHVVVVVFILGLIYSVVMDMLNLQGWTKNAIFNFQNERLLIYFMMFLLGGFCQKQRVFESSIKSIKITMAVLCSVWIPIVFYRYFSMNSDIVVISDVIDTLVRWLCFHLSLAGLMFILINTFRMYLNKQGKISSILSSNSYNVYIIHTIVLGAIAMLLLDIAIPSILKFLILTFMAYGISNGLVVVYREGFKKKIVIRKIKINNV